MGDRGARALLAACFATPFLGHRLGYGLSSTGEVTTMKVRSARPVL